MAESGGLLNRCTGLNLYPGFESLPHRHPPSLANKFTASYGGLAPPRMRSAEALAKADESLPHRQPSPNARGLPAEALAEAGARGYGWRANAKVAHRSGERSECFAQVGIQSIDVPNSHPPSPSAASPPTKSF